MRVPLAAAHEIYRRARRAFYEALGFSSQVTFSGVTAVAREKAAAALLADRIDPLAHRQNDVVSPSFSECIRQFLASNEVVIKSDYVFPDQEFGKPLSDMAMEMALLRKTHDAPRIPFKTEAA